MSKPWQRIVCGVIALRLLFVSVVATAASTAVIDAINRLPDVFASRWMYQDVLLVTAKNRGEKSRALAARVCDILAKLQEFKEVTVYVVDTAVVLTKTRPMVEIGRAYCNRTPPKP